MAAYKILTAKERLNVKIFFQLSQLQLNSIHMCGWSGDIIPCLFIVVCSPLLKLFYVNIIHCLLSFHNVGLGMRWVWRFV